MFSKANGMHRRAAGKVVNLRPTGRRRDAMRCGGAFSQFCENRLQMEQEGPSDKSRLTASTNTGSNAKYLNHLAAMSEYFLVGFIFYEWIPFKLMSSFGNTTMKANVKG